jgi:hypothetical protein
MIKLRVLVGMALWILMSTAQGESAVNVNSIGEGWQAITRQADPFDKTKTEIIQIKKGRFTFRCGEVNMSVSSSASGFDGFSFTAELKYIIDEQDVVDKTGKYSTYLGGSDFVTDDRIYSARISNEEVDSFKKGQILKLAGKFGAGGWTAKEVELDGFASAYGAMCK